MSESGTTANDPVITSFGLQITQGKYIDISGKWTPSFGYKSAIYVWFYHIQGIMGPFLDLVLDVSLCSFQLHEKLNVLEFKLSGLKY